MRVRVRAVGSASRAQDRTRCSAVAQSQLHTTQSVSSPPPTPLPRPLSLFSPARTRGKTGRQSAGPSAASTAPASSRHPRAGRPRWCPGIRWRSCRAPSWAPAQGWGGGGEKAGPEEAVVATMELPAHVGQRAAGGAAGSIACVRTMTLPGFMVSLRRCVKHLCRAGSRREGSRGEERAGGRRGTGTSGWAACPPWYGTAPRSGQPRAGGWRPPASGKQPAQHSPRSPWPHARTRC